MSGEVVPGLEVRAGWRPSSPGRVLADLCLCLPAWAGFCSVPSGICLVQLLRMVKGKEERKHRLSSLKPSAIEATRQLYILQTTHSPRLPQRPLLRSQQDDCLFDCFLKEKSDTHQLLYLIHLFLRETVRCYKAVQRRMRNTAQTEAGGNAARTCRRMGSGLWLLDRVHLHVCGQAWCAVLGVQLLVGSGRESPEESSRGKSSSGHLLHFNLSQTQGEVRAEGNLGISVTKTRELRQETYPCPSHPDVCVCV